jgi:hypothetical protein
MLSGGEDVLLAAVADGAGSASHSQIGSGEAVQHLLKVVSQSGVKAADISQQQVCGWYQEVLEHLRTVADRESLPIGELACTLLLAAVWRNGAVLGQIGDGAWVLEKDGALVAGTWPETGEYANVTVFLTTQGALDHLQFQRFEGKIGGVAGFTDGIQTVALDFGKRTPGERFFNAMFASLRASTDGTELIAPLQQMLASEVICSRTDDDKTLVLGVWREPEAEANPAEVNAAEATPAGSLPAELAPAEPTLVEVNPDGPAE